MLIVLILRWWLLWWLLFAALEELRGHGLGPTHLLFIWFASLFIWIFLSSLLPLELICHTVIDNSSWQLQVLWLVLLLLSWAVMHVEHLLVNVAVIVVIAIGKLKRIRLDAIRAHIAALSKFLLIHRILCRDLLFILFRLCCISVISHLLLRWICWNRGLRWFWRHVKT